MISMAEMRAESSAESLKRKLTDAASEISDAKRNFQGEHAPKEKDEGAADAKVKVPDGGDASLAPTLLEGKSSTEIVARKKEALALQGHSSVDFSQWTLSTASNARNKYGSLNWNLRAAAYDGNVFNFHEFPAEDRQGDSWSTIAWEVKGETFEGAPADKVKVTFEILDSQERTIKRFDETLISLIEHQSMEVLNQKTPVKRETIATLHYKSGLVAKTETRGPMVKMNFVARNENPQRLGVMYYYKLKEDGETHETKPVVARGWKEIEPLIEGHHLRGGKMRATVVRIWSISCLRKEIYPTMEIREMHVREPKRRGIAYAGLTTEQQALMMSME